MPDDLRAAADNLREQIARGRAENERLLAALREITYAYSQGATAADLHDIAYDALEGTPDA